MAHAVCRACGAAVYWRAERGRRLADRTCGRCRGRLATRAAAEEALGYVGPPSWAEWLAQSSRYPEVWRAKLPSPCSRCGATIAVGAVFVRDRAGRVCGACAPVPSYGRVVVPREWAA